MNNTIEVQVWSLYFCSVASMQFHPKNNISYDMDEPAAVARVEDRIAFSGYVADLMIQEYRRRSSEVYRRTKDPG